MPAILNSDISVEIASTWDTISERWRALEQHAQASPFQTAHWIGNWYETFSAPGAVEPVIVTVVERSSGRDLMMIPFVRRSENGIRRIEFADLWVTDYNAPLLRFGHNFHGRFEQEVWPAVLAALPPADVLILRKMPVSLGAMMNPLTTLSAVESSDLSGHIADLGDDWGAYVSSLSKSALRELRRRTAKFANEHGGHLRRITTHADAFAALDVLQQQQTARLAARGAKHVFDDPRYQELYRRQLLQGLTTGHALMFTLVGDGEIVATFLALSNGKGHHTLVRMSQSPEPKWKSLGLGKMIIHRALEVLHAEGCRTFDLSVGSNRYKSEFGVSAIPMAELTARLSWRGAPFMARRKAVTYLQRNPHLMTLARSVAGKLQRPAA
ncbi:GNAT family N-acetyltransferase [Hyphomicrobium sp.]|uniref:GNAT family N-acetyltransferase n=1 Tax=Hyphomicrobium sp. TaxID=82 RepID=UPI002D77E022|nr:GNAT family N-acetyltransferase [Hyphomicrobium sp.]HET6388078.1 GNAT family N-acetyltransferase [Hyphomicrobium sp.]